MTKRTDKKTATKTTSKKSMKSNHPKVTQPDVDLPAPETVTRYELLGVCDFLLVDPGERMPTEARQALFDMQKGTHVICVMQCKGYVFNFTGLPFVTLVDAEGKTTGSSGPNSEADKPAAA